MPEPNKSAEITHCQQCGEPLEPAQFYMLQSLGIECAKCDAKFLRNFLADMDLEEHVSNG